MSVKIMVHENKDGQVLISEVSPIEILKQVAQVAKDSEDLYQFSEKVKAIPAADLHFSLLWDKYNTLKIADSMMNGLLSELMKIDEDGGRNDN